MVALMFFIHYIFVGDIVSLTLPTTLSALDTPCHLYGLYNACAANPKVLLNSSLNLFCSMIIR